MKFVELSRILRFSSSDKKLRERGVYSASAGVEAVEVKAEVESLLFV
jgi:hypothetical protein